MMAQKNPTNVGMNEIKNNFNSFNGSGYCRKVQVFRKELPLMLKNIPLKQRIKLLDEMIPKIQITQMARFAESLQTAYLMELEAQGQWRRY